MWKRARDVTLIILLATLSMLTLFVHPAIADVGRLDLAWQDTATSEDGFQVEKHAGACATGGTFTQIGMTLPAYTDIGQASGSTCYSMEHEREITPVSRSGSTLMIEATVSG